MGKFLVTLGVLVSVFLIACGSSAEVSRAPESAVTQNSGGAGAGRRASLHRRLRVCPDRKTLFPQNRKPLI